MIRQVIAGTARDFTDAIVLMLSAIVLLSTMHFGLTVSMIIIMPLIFVITRKYSSYIRPKYVELRNKSANINTVAQENISGNRVVKAFSREEHEEMRFAECCEDYVSYNLDLAVKHNFFVRIISFLTEMLGVIMIALGGYFVVTTTDNVGVWQLTLGELAAFSSMRYMLATPLQTMSAGVNQLQRFFASADKVIEIYYDELLAKKGRYYELYTTQSVAENM